MIDSLYPCFRHWSEKGSVYIFSDTHFEDEDCKLMDKDWISPQLQVEILKKYVHKNDTLIHLGDVGNPEWLRQIRGYKVLIAGNHDKGLSFYEPYFHELYAGPLMISDKIFLSHEPCDLPFAYNIHGHDHAMDHKGDVTHLNVAANVIGYIPVSLGVVVKSGVLNRIPGIHRIVIDKASGRR